MNECNQPECRAKDHPSLEVATEIMLNKLCRRNADEMIQQLKERPPTRERALAITKFQEGVMWLGMDLKRINDENPGAMPNPYPNSKDPSNTKIDPTADGLKL